MSKRGNGEGSIYPVKDKAGKVRGYRASYTVQTIAGQKRKYLSGKTRKEVAAKLSKAVAEREDGLVFDSENLTLAEYLERWLKDGVKGSVRAGTYARYEQLCRSHIKPTLGSVKLSALTPAHVQRFYTEKLSGDLSPRTVQYMHDTLRKSLRQAVKWGLIPHNVTEAVEAPKASKRDIHPLSPTEARRLLSVAAEDRLEAVFVLAVTTGMRQGEILGLQWNDVDLDRAKLQIRRTLIAQSGSPKFGQPKTARGRRAVSLAPETVDALRRHRKRQFIEGLHSSDGLVFCTQAGKPVTPQNLTQRVLKRLLVKAELPPIRFHDLRHTAATILLGQGVNPKIVQEMLGHASIQLTLDTYSHVLPDMQSAAVEAMQDALG